MSNLQDGFRRTVTSFKNRLTRDELQQVQCNSLSDLNVIIKRVQYEQLDQKQLMNFTRIQSFLEAMEQFEQVITVFVNVNDIVAYIWGPIKFLLLVSTYSDIPGVLPSPNRAEHVSSNFGMTTHPAALEA